MGLIVDNVADRHAPEGRGGCGPGPTCAAHRGEGRALGGTEQCSASHPTKTPGAPGDGARDCGALIRLYVAERARLSAKLRRA